MALCVCGCLWKLQRGIILYFQSLHFSRLKWRNHSRKIRYEKKNAKKRFFPQFQCNWTVFTLFAIANNLYDFYCFPTTHPLFARIFAFWLIKFFMCISLVLANELIKYAQHTCEIQLEKSHNKNMTQYRHIMVRARTNTSAIPYWM